MEKFTLWQKFYTAAGTDGMDKFQLCLNLLWTYSEPTLNLLWTYSKPTLNLLWTYPETLKLQGVSKKMYFSQSGTFGGSNILEQGSNILEPKNIIFNILERNEERKFW